MTQVSSRRDLQVDVACRLLPRRPCSSFPGSARRGRGDPDRLAAGEVVAGQRAGLARPRRVPSATMRPPCTPAPGPMSTTWSAQADGVLVVLDHDHRVAQVAQVVRVPSRRSLSRWCRPMEGSSSTYITPTRPAPIWLARRMRCASPPDRCRRCGPGSGSRGRR